MEPYLNRLAYFTRDVALVLGYLPDFLYGFYRIARYDSDKIPKGNRYFQIALFLGTPIVLLWRILELIIGNRTEIWLLPTGVTYRGNPTLNTYPNEKWYFINGICTDQETLKWDCERLERRFRQQIQGIYNRTYGPIIDILECISQRTLNYDSALIKQVASIIKNDLSDPTIEKVVLMGHSQGAIILSLLMKNTDIRDLAAQYPNKLSIHTFGSAADEFSNVGGNVFTEHYVNRFEPVALIGALWFLNSYSGNVFVKHNGVGHLMFNYDVDIPPTHYTNGAAAKLINLP